MRDFSSLLHVQDTQITNKIRARATYHRDYIEVYEPFVPYDKLEEGWEKSHKSGSSLSATSENQSNLERSLRRTKRTVKQYAKYNDFELWVTLTLKADRHNDSKSLDGLHKWLRAQKRHHGVFRYILVPERHKDGALHFHGLFGEYKGQLKRALNNNRGSRYFGTPLIQNKREVYNLAEYDLGFSKVEYIESPEKISTYITKYITKDIPQIGKYKKRYWASNGLQLPPSEENPPWFEQAKPEHTNVINLNGHGTLWFFRRDTVPTPSY